MAQRIHWTLELVTEDENARIEGALQGVHIRFENLSAHVRSIYPVLQVFQPDMVVIDDANIDDFEEVEWGIDTLRGEAAAALIAQRQQLRSPCEQQQTHNQVVMRAIQDQAQSQCKVVDYVAGSWDVINTRLREEVVLQANKVVANSIGEFKATQKNGSGGSEKKLIVSPNIPINFTHHPPHATELGHQISEAEVRQGNPHVGERTPPSAQMVLIARVATWRRNCEMNKTDCTGS